MLHIENRNEENGVESAPEIEAMDDEQQFIIEDEGGGQPQVMGEQNQEDVDDIQDDEAPAIINGAANVSQEEEGFVEPSEDKDGEELLADEDTYVPALVADLDNHAEDVCEGSVDRPGRANSGAGVDRLHTYFESKGCSSTREFNLAIHRGVKKSFEHHIQR